MNIGKLNKRLIYNKQGTTVSDGYGGSTYITGDEVETWAAAKMLGMDTALRYGLEATTKNYIFSVRYQHGKNMRVGDVVKYKNENYKIKQLLNVDEEQNEVTITASLQL